MGAGMPRTLAKVLRREFKGPVTVDDRDLLHLDPSHPGMLTLRRKVRVYAEKALIEGRKKQHQETVFRIYQEARLKRHRREQADALTLRRALVRALPERNPVLYGRLDAAEREIRTWPVDDIDGIAADLAGYDVVAGLAPRVVLERTGVDPAPLALRDLSPPNKTRVISRRGRVLRITPQLLITGTVRVSRPLADPKVVAKYVKEGHLGRLRRRLESDLKTLYAFYRYGTLHRAARLRWGFLDEWVPVEWAEEGDLMLRELLQSAVADGRELEVVTGHAPSFTDPWARARRIRVIGPRRFGPAILLDVATEEEVWAADVQAARLV